MGGFLHGQLDLTLFLTPTVLDFLVAIAVAIFIQKFMRFYI